MLRDAWFIASKDIRYLLRERQSLLWLFIMPIVFFYFIGTVTSVGGARPAEKKVLALETHPEAGFLSDQVTARLEENGYRVVHAGGEVNPTTHTRSLTLPAGLTSKVLAGDQVNLILMQKEDNLSAEQDLVSVARSIYTVLADVVTLASTGNEITPAAFDELQAMPRAMQLTTRPAGRRLEIPSGFEQAVPGIMVMFTLIVLTTSGSAMLVIERNEGLLRRLASTPISRSSLILGKWCARMVIAAVQILFAVAAGSVLFKMDWGPNPLMIGVVLFSWAALCASLGLLSGSLARTEGQAVGLGILATNLLAALGGCWWPIEITPQWMQKLALLLPTGWAMDAMHRLISFQHPPAVVTPHVVIILIAALVAGAGAVKVFRYQ
jgi:ABC-type multidrug transport system permease subunit